METVENTRAENLEITTTIYKQMRVVGPFVGAHNLVAIENGLQFSFKGSRRVNKVVVVLAPSDTYTVMFWRISPTDPRKNKVVFTIDDVYCDQLQEIFEDVTGLVTGPSKVRFGGCR